MDMRLPVSIRQARVTAVDMRALLLGETFQQPAGHRLRKQDGRYDALLMRFVPLLVALVVTLGTMVLLGIKLNVLNLSIGAIVVGVGIDYPIHIIESFLQKTGRGSVSSLEAMRRTLQSMGTGVWAGTLTTLIGFAACTILAMPVAVSFGLLTALAIACVYLASVFLLPAPLVRAQANGLISTFASPPRGTA